MAENVKILYEECIGEIVEKKSRFIACLRPVATLEEANAFVEEKKKQYWDARHNCSAFVIGENKEITRCSDDGEPSGTAGRPMLEVLLGEGVHNVAAVVTRYFGGVLLGTGGLVRAYQGAMKEALKNANIITKTCGKTMDLVVDYNGIGKLQYIMAGKGIIPLDTIYAADVTAKLVVADEIRETFIKEVTEGLNGNVTFDMGEDVYFAVIDGKTTIM